MATDLQAPPSTPPATIATPRRGRTRRRLLTHAGIIAVAIVLLYPLIWMVFSSVKPTTEIFSEPGLLPHTWQWSNYTTGWHGVGVSFSIFFENSLYISAVAVIGNVVSCSLAAYAFARLDFSFKRTAFAVMLVTLMLPSHVTLIPQYIMFNHIGWVNSFYPLTIPHFFAVDAFFIFLMVQFIRGLPRDLDDAARLDGCGPLRIFWHIVLPLLRPALVTTVILTFIWTYNDFFKQLIYLDDPNMFTVPLGLRMFLDATEESSWGPMLAMSTVALIPAMVLFATFQRQIVDGIATTGLRG